MGVRRKAREFALQILYQNDVLEIDHLLGIELFSSNFQINKKSMEYACQLVIGVSENWQSINSQIKDNSENWRIDRMLIVDRNIIRIALYELEFCPDIPASVAINEALELAKAFCDSDSGSFINGVLDAVNKGNLSNPPPEH
jgi:transcription antitermination protein NusB